MRIKCFFIISLIGARCTWPGPLSTTDGHTRALIFSKAKKLLDASDALARDLLSKIRRRWAMAMAIWIPGKFGERIDR
uniref:Putative secreted protein n=1 Tax=Anopheles marajoara TaxID=58244 RepID=A0A2M4CCS8_9DIPT